MRLLAATLLLTLLPAIACGGGGSSTIDAEKAISDAEAAVNGVRSFHFKLTHENGTTPLPLSLSLVSAEGDVAIPDRLAADVQARAASINVSVKVIGIGDRTWITNPFTRGWQSLPGATIQDFADPQALLAAVVESLDNVSYVDTSSMDGTRVHHLTGKFDSGVLAGTIPTAEAGHQVSVDVWIGVADSLPRRARLAGRLSADEPQNIVRDLAFSRFNETVDIRAP